MNALESFALEVLEIMERDSDWSADTTDAIATAAYDRRLAGTDENGKFERTELGGGA